MKIEPSTFESVVSWVDLRLRYVFFSVSTPSIISLRYWLRFQPSNIFIQSSNFQFAIRKKGAGVVRWRWKIMLMRMKKVFSHENFGFSLSKSAMKVIFMLIVALFRSLNPIRWKEIGEKKKIERRSRRENCELLFANFHLSSSQMFE